MSSDLLKAGWVRVRQSMSVRGFRTKRKTLYRVTDEQNVVLLAIQSSAKSSSGFTDVTVNYGVHSALLSRRLQEDPESMFDIWNAHWRERINEDGCEKWLRVSSHEPPEQVAQRLLGAMEVPSLELSEKESNAALRDVWLSGQAPGISHLQRLLYLSILLHEIGPRERLDEVLSELLRSVDQKPQQPLVLQRLRFAGIEV
jgi:hypothetical protein